jgi:PBSX family phage portal protein
MTEELAISRRFKHKLRLQNFHLKLAEALAVVQKDLVTAVGRVTDEEVKDQFTTSLYSQYALLIPPYSPERLYRIFEESSVLPTCIQAMIDNIPGFGYDYIYQNGKVLPENSVEKAEMEDLLSQANETQSFLSVRRDARRDIEVTGNGYYEVVRYPDRTIALIYQAKATNMRITALDEEPQRVKVFLRRKGKIVESTIKKRFRKFAYLVDGTTNKVRWLKEFGDPRAINPETGDYMSSRSRNQANEIIHIKLEGGLSPYGVPRWIGNMMNVLGTRAADYVNYDIFNNQGIPPLLVLISGGVLTDESIDDLENMFAAHKGMTEFNKLAILEAEDMSGDVDSPNKARIDVKPLTEYRKEDQMFGDYIDKSSKYVRQSFRLPPLLIGTSESYSFASSKTSRLIAEEQIFKPERLTEDEQLSATLFGHLPEWKFRTKGPEVIRSDEVASLFAHLTNSGALTVNDAVDIANKMFDLKLERRVEDWAELPLAIVLALAKAGRLKLPEGIVDESKLQPAGDGQRFQAPDASPDEPAVEEE